MTLNIHTNNGVTQVKTKASITIKDILEQLEQGNLILIETVNNTTFIINCINVNAIEIL